MKTTDVALRGLLAALLLTLVACGTDPDDPDDGPPPDDPDLGMEVDMGMDVEMDLGVDGGVDMGPDPDFGVDAGPLPDAGVDMGPIPDGIQDVRDFDPPGATGGIDVNMVTVTYTRPAIDNDPAGFFVQASAMGPAVFVSVDPTTTTPPLVEGDVVSFSADETEESGGLLRVTAISSLTRSMSGADTSLLEQDLSAANDVVTALDDYESELITIAGDTVGNPGFAGTGHSSIQLDTAGVSGNADLRFRFTNDVNDVLGIVEGCTLTVGPTPLWRFNDDAQPQAIAVDEVSGSCPAIEVVSAAPVDATTAVVELTRPVDPATVDASDFAVENDDGPATVDSVVVEGTIATLTFDGDLDGGVEYTVTVTGVDDAFGTAIDAVANTATFIAISSVAEVLVNEVNANVGGGCDLIELRVTAGGSLDGMQIRERTSTVLTFPAGFTAETDDLIVVHFDSGDTNCTGGGPAPADEVVAADDVPATTVSTNYDTAFDFYVSDTGLTNTDNVIAIRNSGSVIIDCVFISDDSSGTAASGSESAADDAVTDGQWTNPDGTVPSGGFVDDDFNRAAVQDSNGTGTDATGESIQRNTDGDNDNRNDWTQAAQSWGALNTGQTATP